MCLLGPAGPQMAFPAHSPPSPEAPSNLQSVPSLLPSSSHDSAGLGLHVLAGGRGTRRRRLWVGTAVWAHCQHPFEKHVFAGPLLLGSPRHTPISVRARVRGLRRGRDVKCRGNLSWRKCRKLGIQCMSAQVPHPHRPRAPRFPVPASMRKRQTDRPVKMNSKKKCR